MFVPPKELLVAPYRFVGLNSVVAKPPFDFASFDRSKRLSGGYSAEIDVTFECETPLLVGWFFIGAIRLAGEKRHCQGFGSN